MYAVSVLDGEGDDDTRVARLCATLTHAIYNAVRLSGKPVPDNLYRKERDYLPQRQRLPETPRQQSWDEMKRNLGW